MVKESLIECDLFSSLGIKPVGLIAKVYEIKKVQHPRASGTLMKDCYPLATVSSILNVFIFT